MWDAIKRLWTAKIPYGEYTPSNFKKERQFVAKHGSILLTGLAALLGWQAKWALRLGVAAVSDISTMSKSKPAPEPEHYDSIEVQEDPIDYHMPQELEVELTEEGMNRPQPWE